MATSPQQPESDVVLGIVKKAWPYDEAKPTAPAKLVIDTDDGTVADIAFYNAWDDFENKVHASPPRLGEQWAKIDPARDEGRRIQIICYQALVKGTDEQKFYDGRPQFVMGKGASIKFLDAAPATPPGTVVWRETEEGEDASEPEQLADPVPAAAPAAPAPVPAARAKSIDGARWGNNLNNSTLVNVNVPLEQQAAVWTKILRDAAWLYQLTAEDIAAFLEDDDDSGDDALLATV